MEYDFKKQAKSAIGVASGLATGNIFGAIKSGLEGTMGLFSSSSKASAKAAQMQYEYNLALQKQAQQWDEYMYKNRYQMQREDLEKAGINPLYGLGNAGTITSGQGNVSMPEMVQEANNKINNFINMLNAGATLSAKQAETKLINEKANTEKFNSMIRALEVKTQQLENIQRKKYIDKQDKILETQIKKDISLINNTIANTESQKLDNKPKQRYEEWANNNKGISKFVEGIQKNDKGIGAMLGLLLGGGLIGKEAMRRATARKVGF